MSDDPGPFADFHTLTAELRSIRAELAALRAENESLRLILENASGRTEYEPEILGCARWLSIPTSDFVEAAKAGKR